MGVRIQLFICRYARAGLVHVQLCSRDRSSQTWWGRRYACTSAQAAWLHPSRWQKPHPVADVLLPSSQFPKQIQLCRDVKQWAAKQVACSGVGQTAVLVKNAVCHGNVVR